MKIKDKRHKKYNDVYDDARFEIAMSALNLALHNLSMLGLVLKNKIEFKWGKKEIDEND
jgi:hypothetical protein